MEDKKLSNIQKMLKKCISPLLELVLKANREVTKLEDAGYKITLNSWSHAGGYSEAFSVELEECMKDFAKSKAANKSTGSLLKSLKCVTKELTSLANENYWIEMTTRRPNGNNKLFIKEIKVILRDDDFGKPQLLSQL